MQKENSSLRSEYLFAALLCIAVAIFIVILIVCGSCQKEEQSAPVSSADTSSDVSFDDSLSVPSSETSTPVDFVTVEVSSEEKMKGLLAVTTLPTEGDSETPQNLEKLYFANNEIYGLSGSMLSLTKAAREALNRMATDFKAAKGKNNLLIYKAYTAASALEDRTVEADLTTGNAVSFSVYPADPDGDYIGSGKFLWLVDNCFQYGYIQRYPSEKASATHVSGSGSGRIYRYVGEAHATYMGTYHLCLEEYLDALRSFTPEQPLEITYQDASGNQRTCFTYYVAANGEKTSLQIRADSESSYTVSGNGSDGFVVTCYPAS